LRLRVLKPNGLLFFTTPSYGARSLRMIENTALEAVTRLQHLSREVLHHAKMDEARLASTPRAAGVKTLSIESGAVSWVLTAYGRKS